MASSARYGDDWGSYYQKRGEREAGTSRLGIKDDRRHEDQYHRDDRSEHRRDERRDHRRDRDERDRPYEKEERYDKEERYEKDYDRRGNGHGRSSPLSSRRDREHHRERSRRRTSTPQVEEGEIESSDVGTKQEISLDEGERPASPDIPPPTSSPEKAAEHFPRKKLIRHTKPHTPDYPAPPPPPEDSPPPRPPTPPLSAPDLDIQTPNGPSPSTVPYDGSQGHAVTSLKKPVNRALEATKALSRYDDQPSDVRNDNDIPVPDAPNRNLLQPITRASTPVDKGERVQVEHMPKGLRRFTVEEEMSRLKKEFKGTTTLAAYDVGSKLGEGTFG